MLTPAVELPGGELIDCHDLARAVASFRHPVPEEGATGMACITGSKMVDYSFKARSEGSASGERMQQQATLDFPAALFDPTPYAIPCPPFMAGVQLSLPIRGMMSEHSLPARLSLKNRMLLAALLDELPPLVYPMSEWEQGRFLAGFREKMETLQLVEEQYWEPILVTESYVELQRRRHDDFFAEHGMIALEEEFSQGLNIVDRAGHPIETFDARLGRGHYFLSRTLAINLLRESGIPYRDADGPSPGNGPSDKADMVRQSRKAGTPWSREQVQKLYEEYKLHTGKVVAKMHGISESRLNQLFKKHGFPRKSRAGRKPGHGQKKSATWHP
ncbi:hypothetical protein ACKI2N_015760 [Cupriavidus sp. 30B13]|uniref:hypothetical protein n=1 Tax=Cupriavidus sp. 30B13 TaxID=3384241 RepID=UPI003B91BA3D